MRELFQDQYMSAQLDEGAGILHIKRSGARLGTAGIEDLWRALVKALAPLDRSKLKLLMDLREAPLRNDPGFEEAIRQLLAQLFMGFAKVAVLVRTAVGELQTSRHRREGGFAGGVFKDEAQALAYLSGKDDA
jgi:hypothetical protein